MNMSISSIMFFDCLLLCLLFCFFVVQSAVPLILDCPNSTIYNTNSTSGSIYSIDVDFLLPTLISNASQPNGFYNFTAGSLDSSKPTAAHGLFLCQGDVKPDACRKCAPTAGIEILKMCPDRKTETIWYDNCMLRYSNRSNFSISDTSIAWFLPKTQNLTNTIVPNQVLGDPVDQIAIDAANNDISAKTFAVKEANSSACQRKLNASGQCTSDLSRSECHSCLMHAIAFLAEYCGNREGASIFLSNCNIRYENYLFCVNPTLPPPPEPEPNLPIARPPLHRSARNKDNGGISTQTIVAIPVSIFAAMVMLVVIFCIVRRSRKKYNAAVETTGVTNFTTRTEFLQFNLSEIEACTNNFAVTNRIGEGGFGPVYKGTLPNGQDIAVKSLSKTSRQGAEEFVNEIALVTKLQHRNLVRLLGYCLDREEMQLIYEFVPNKSLDYFLFDPEKKRLLDWSTRYKIIGGIARGLLYLHQDSQLKIIHRDLKASNVLLDTNMNPKIADFGMARHFEVDQSEGNTNKIAGTFGYMAPEYALHGLFSVKSDVFSLGVLILEIISGKKNSSFLHCHGDDLPGYAWRQWRDGTPLALVDPSIGESYPRNEVIQSIHIGLLCVQDDVAQRPTMRSVVLMQNSYYVTLPTPNPPAFFGRTRTDQSFPGEQPVAAESKKSETSKSLAPDSSTNDLSISELYPR